MKNKTQLSLIPKLDSLGSVFDSLTDQIWKDFEVVASPFMSFRNGKGHPFMGDTLWDETDSEFVQEFELPRFKKEDIKISIEDKARFTNGFGSMLHISAEKDNKYRFYHSTNIPEAADISQNPEAKLDHGVLTVSFKKKESAKPRMIEIK